MLELILITGFILLVILPFMLFMFSEWVRGIKHYVKTFSLRNEWEALKSVKFYKEK